MENPLAKYLSEHSLPQAKFAERGPWRQATISAWCNGPISKLADALAVQQATDGAVTVVDWAEYAASLPEYTWPRIPEQPDAPPSPAPCVEQDTNGEAA